MKKILFAGMAILAGIAAAGVENANAAPINSLSIDSSHSGQLWTYSLTTSFPPADGTITNGAFFEVYDFGPGTISNLQGVLAAPGWTSSFVLSDPRFGVSDDPTLENIQFTYTGNALTCQGECSGSFDVFSPKGEPSGRPFRTTQAFTDNGNGTHGFSSVSAPSFVPEPATLALMGAGLAGFGMIRRRKAS